jgi:hypothetical protein
MTLLKGKPVIRIVNCVNTFISENLIFLDNYISFGKECPRSYVGMNCNSEGSVF